MFRGIDPEGLLGLSQDLDLRGTDARDRIRRSVTIIQNSCSPSATGAIASSSTDLDRWASDTITTLRWRADAIRTGQNTALNLFAMLKAEFAATVPFSAEALKESLRDWIANAAESRRLADAAVADITRWLDQSLTDWDVFSNDLHNIETTLRNLSPAALNLVISDLTPAQLHRWIKEMGHSLNGFSQGEKQRLFRFLAENADGDALGKVHDAILTAAGAEAATDFGRAIQLVSADRVIAEFVRYAVSQELAGHVFSTVAPALAITGIEDADIATNTVRRVLEVEGFVGTLAVDTIALADPNTSGNPDPLHSLVETALRAGDAETRAILFVSLGRLAGGPSAPLAQQLIDRHDVANAGMANQLLGDLEDSLVSNMTNLVTSDANAIVELLATTHDPDGELTATYLWRLTQGEHYSQLAELATALRGGDIVDVDRFSAVGTNPDYEYAHAQNLAFFAASLRIGLEKTADDAKRQIGLIAAGASAATALVGAAYTPISKAAGFVMALAGSAGDTFILGESADSVSDDLDTQFDDLVEFIEDRFQPQDRGELGPATLGNARWAWDSRWDQVLDR